MDFKVTYRAPDGALRIVCIEATSRSTCMAECRRRGITPAKIVQGGGRHSEGGVRRAGTRALSAPVASVAFLVVALLAIGIWWWLAPHDTRHADPGPPEIPSDGIQAETSQRVAKPAPHGSRVPTPAHATSATIYTPDPQSADIPSPADIPPAGDSTAEALQQEQEEESKPNPHPRTAAETFLVMITPREPGERMPPAPIPPDMDEEEVDKALSNAVKANASDDERSIQAKLTLLEQKEEFRKLREQGMTFSEYLRRLEEKFHGQAKLLDDARNLNDELYNDRTISDEDYLANKQKINDVLRKEGLPPLEEDKENEKEQ